MCPESVATREICRDQSLRVSTLMRDHLCVGYEEAAAQGLVAGMNAARRAGGLEPVSLPRNSSYIGTLIDDLVTKDLREPYRCAPSRPICDLWR